MNQWFKMFGGISGVNSVGSISADGSGNVFLAGVNKVGSSGTPLFVKLNSSGVPQWAYKFGVNAGASAASYVRVDAASGNVYFAVTGLDGVRLAKLTSAGALSWERVYGAGTEWTVKAIAVDGSGNLYVCGSAGSGASMRMCTAKYNGSGVLQWQRKFVLGTTDGYFSQGAVAVDSSGNAYVTGALRSDAGNVAVYVAKYSTAGALQWQRKITGVQVAGGSEICCDASGVVFVRALVSGGSPAVLSYSAAGALQWQKQRSGVMSGVVADGSNVFLAGGSGTIAVALDALDYSGAVSFQNEFSSGGAFSLALADVRAGYLYLCGSSSGASTEALVARVNANGSTTGSFGAYSYGGGFGSFTTSSMTDNTGDGTDSAASETDAAGSDALSSWSFSPTLLWGT